MVGDPRIDEANRDGLRRATWPPSRAWSTWCPPATPLPPWRPPSAASCTPGRRSPGPTCAARSRARSPAPSSTKAGLTTSRPPRALAGGGADRLLDPCHEHGAVGPMAGIISPSMPVWVVENTAARQPVVFCNLNEGLGKVLRFGANSPEVLDRLRWLGTEFFAAMQTAVRGLADPDLKPLMAQALHMGDELHNRNAAATGAAVQAADPGAARAPASTSAAVERALRVRRRQRPLLPEHLDGGMQVHVGRRPRRAGQHHGHGHGPQRRQLRHPPERHRRPSGSRRPPMPSTASTSPATPSPTPRADLGDSAITETNGLGGFAMAASPAIVQVRRRHAGGRDRQQPPDAVDHARHQPGLHPAGAQLRRHAGRASTPAWSLDSGVLPIINTGIAHKKAGVGQIGAGITTAPMECFSRRHRRAGRHRLSGSSGRMTGVAVVAFGGNALVTDDRASIHPAAVRHRRAHRTPPGRHDRRPAGDWSSSHGNGPQVGFILRRTELADDEVDPVPRRLRRRRHRRAPSATCSSRALTNELARRGLAPAGRGAGHAFGRRSSTTRPLPAPEQAGRLVPRRATARSRWPSSSAGTIVEDSGRGWRRAVASPRPAAHPRDAKRSPPCSMRGAVVVAAGGGGIPVAVHADGTRAGRRGRDRQGPGRRPARPRTSAPTCCSSRPACREWRSGSARPSRALAGHASPSKRPAQYCSSGEFGAGSMEPKVEAVAEFVAARPGAVGVIGAPDEIADILAGRSGTRIVANQAASSATRSSLTTAVRQPPGPKE